MIKINKMNIRLLTLIILVFCSFDTEARRVKNIASIKLDSALSKDENKKISSVFKRYRYDTRICIESAILKDSKTKVGITVVEFMLNRQGFVKSNSIKIFSPSGKYFQDCFIGNLIKWEFPKQIGDESTFKYHFQISTY